MCSYTVVFPPLLPVGASSVSPSPSVYGSKALMAIDSIWFCLSLDPLPCGCRYVQDSNGGRHSPDECRQVQDSIGGRHWMFLFAPRSVGDLVGGKRLHEVSGSGNSKEGWEVCRRRPGTNLSQWVQVGPRPIPYILYFYPSHFQIGSFFFLVLYSLRYLYILDITPLAEE